MSKVSGCLWLVVGLILALVAGGITFVTLQKAAIAKSQESAGKTVQAVVAARPVQAGTLLSEADLTLQAFPADSLPAGARNKVADAAGQVTMVPMTIGEMVLDHHLTRPDITSNNLGFTLPEGQVAVTLSPSDLMSAVELVKPGSHVDIYYSLEVPGNAGSGSGDKSDKLQYTFGTLQGVTIVGMIAGGTDEKAQSSAPLNTKLPTVGGIQAYVLALNPQDALVLKYLRDAGAAMDLAIRNVADETEHEMQPVDLPYLIDKYQLPVP